MTESREGLPASVAKREPPVPAAKFENFKKELMEELERKWNNINEHQEIINLWTAVNEKNLKHDDVQ